MTQDKDVFIVWFSPNCKISDIIKEQPVQTVDSSIIILYGNGNYILGYKANIKPSIIKINPVAASLPKNSPMFPPYEKLKEIIKTPLV